jgi:uncharacterized delta-60 repeat protein
VDKNFGTNGKIIADFKGYANSVNEILVQNDSSIVAVGSAFQGQNCDFVLARYTVAGKPDNRFGTGGTVITSFTPYFDEPTAAVMVEDEKLVVAGYTNFMGDSFHSVIVRYKKDGSIDPKFGSQGKVIASNYFSGLAFSVARCPGGKVATGGGFGGGFGAARYNGCTTVILEIGKTLYEGDSLVVGNNVYKTAGTYTDTLESGYGCDSVVHLTLSFIPKVIGIKENDAAHLAITISPNPGPGIFRLSFYLHAAASGSMSLYDITGKQVLSKDLGVCATGQNYYHIDVSHLPAGMYYLRLQAGDAVSTAPVVLTK